MSNETRVGIFVICIIFAFILLSINIGEIDLKRKGTYPMQMQFASVEGLKEGSPLEVAGVIVGRVESIALGEANAVDVWVKLNEDIRLPVDSQAVIASKGVLGDKRIILYPGRADALIDEGGRLRETSSPASMDAIFAQLSGVAGDLAEISNSLKNMLDAEMMAELQSTMQNIHDISASANLMVQANSDSFSSLLSNLDETSDNIALISADLTTASQGISSLVEGVAAGEGSLGKILTDETFYNTLLEIMQRVELLAGHLDDENNISLLLSDSTLYYNIAEISENIKILSDQAVAGQGTLGHILSDEEMYELLKETLGSANSAVKGLEEQTPISVMGTVLGLIW